MVHSLICSGNLMVNIKTRSTIIGTPIEQKRPDYPIEAIYQLVRNAVLHRTYEATNAPIRIFWFSDRIEISSPGGLFGQVTAQNFGTVADYRNPHIAEVMKNLGYVQRFGVGISIAKAQMKRNGNPEPLFQFDDNHVLVTMRSNIEEEKL